MYQGSLGYQAPGQRRLVVPVLVALRADSANDRCRALSLYDIWIPSPASWRVNDVVLDLCDCQWGIITGIGAVGISRTAKGGTQERSSK